MAKVINIKQIQHDGTNARLEYESGQEELYIHFNCLRIGIPPTISCPAKDPNRENSIVGFRIIHNTKKILPGDESENTESLVRNNLLNF